MDAEMLGALARLAGLFVLGFLLIVYVVEPLLSDLPDEGREIILNLLTALLVAAAAVALVWLWYERQMPGGPRWTAPGHLPKVEDQWRLACSDPLNFWPLPSAACSAFGQRASDAPPGRNGSRRQTKAAGHGHRPPCRILSLESVKDRSRIFQKFPSAMPIWNFYHDKK